MRRLILVSTLLLGVTWTACAADAVPVVETSDGRTLKDVKVLRVDGADVLLIHSEGAARVPLAALTDDVRRTLGLRTRKEQAEFDAQQEAKAVLHYAGKPRDQGWVDAQYEKYGSQLGIADGRLYDLVAACAKAKAVQLGAPEPGTEIRYVSRVRVFQVLGPSDLLVKISNDWQRTFNQRFGWVMMEVTVATFYIHLENFPTRGLTDDTPFAGDQVFLRYTGTYRYATANGASSTVPNYVPLQKPTKAEFLDALKAGSVLSAASATK